MEPMIEVETEGDLHRAYFACGGERHLLLSTTDAVGLRERAVRLAIDDLRMISPAFGKLFEWAFSERGRGQERSSRAQG